MSANAGSSRNLKDLNIGCDTVLFTRRMQEHGGLAYLDRPFSDHERANGCFAAAPMIQVCGKFRCMQSSDGRHAVARVTSCISFAAAQEDA